MARTRAFIEAVVIRLVLIVGALLSLTVWAGLIHYLKGLQ